MIPANVTLDNSDGSGINIKNGKTLSVNGPILNAPGKQIFFNALGGAQGTVSLRQNTSIATLYPQWWGATGDGSTDDSTTLQASLNAAAGRAVELVPTATYYKITTALITSSNTTFRIDQGATLRQVTTTLAVIRVAWPGNQSNITIEGGGTIESTYVNGPGAVTGKSFFGLIETSGVNTTDKLIIRNLTIRNAYGVGIMVGNNACTNTEILNCDIYNTADFALGAAGSMLIQGNRIHGARYAGIDGGYKGVRIIGNEIYSNGGGPLDTDSWDGIIVNSGPSDGPTNVIIANNFIHDNLGQGIYVAASDGSKDSTLPRWISITGNQIYNQSTDRGSSHKPAGILVSSSKGVSIVGNVSRDNYYNYAILSVDTFQGVALSTKAANMTGNISANATNTGIIGFLPRSAVTGNSVANVALGILIANNISLNDATPISLPNTGFYFASNNIVIPGRETLGPEIIPDPGFEGEGIKWTALSGATLTRANERRPGSNGSFCLDAQIGTSLAVGDSETFPLIEGHLYKVSVWARNVVGTNAELIVQDVASGAYEFASPLFTTSSWEQRVGYFRATHSGPYRLKLTTGKMAGAKARFDDVSVREVQTTPYEAGAPK